MGKRYAVTGVSLPQLIRILGGKAAIQLPATGRASVTASQLMACLLQVVVQGAGRNPIDLLCHLGIGL